MVLQEVQLYGAARRVQTQEGLNYFVAPKGMCELKKKKNLELFFGLFLFNSGVFLPLQSEKY